MVPSVVRNVVATIKGRAPGGRPLAVTTPRNGCSHCDGGGGGLVCWVEVLRALRDAPPASNDTLVASSAP